MKTKRFKKKRLKDYCTLLLFYKVMSTNIEEDNVLYELYEKIDKSLLEIAKMKKQVTPVNLCRVLYMYKKANKIRDNVYYPEILPLFKNNIGEADNYSLKMDILISFIVHLDYHAGNEEILEYAWLKVKKRFDYAKFEELIKKVYKI